MTMPARDGGALLTPAHAPEADGGATWPAGPPSPAPAPPSVAQDAALTAALNADSPTGRTATAVATIVRSDSLLREPEGRPGRQAQAVVPPGHLPPSQVQDVPSAAGGTVLWRLEEDSSLLVTFDGDYTRALYFRYDESANTVTPVAVTAAADGSVPLHGDLKLSGFYKELGDESMVPASMDEYVAYFAAVARYVPGAALPPRVLVTLLCGEASMLFTYKQDKGVTLKGTVLYNEGGELSELTPTQFELRKGGISCRNWRKSFNVEGCLRVMKGAGGGGAGVSLGVACMRDMAEYLETVLDINNTQRKRPRANGRVTEALTAAQQALAVPPSRPPHVAPPEKRVRRASAAAASSPPPAPDQPVPSEAELTDEDYVPAPARGGGVTHPQRPPGGASRAPLAPRDPRRPALARGALEAPAVARRHLGCGYAEEAHAAKARSSREPYYDPSFALPEVDGGAWRPHGVIPQGVPQPRDPALSRCEAQAIQLILASTSGDCTKHAVQGILRHVLRYHSPAAPGRRVSWALREEEEEEEDDGRAARGRAVSFSPPAMAPSSPPPPASLPRASLQPLVRQKWRSQLRMQQGDDERQAAEEAAAEEAAAAGAAAGGVRGGAEAMEEDVEAAAHPARSDGSGGRTADAPPQPEEVAVEDAGVPLASVALARR